MQFSLLDIVIFLIILYLIVRGIMVGFFRGSLAILALIIGFYAATFYYNEVMNLLTELLPSLSSYSLKILSFIIVFLVIYIVIRIIGVTIVRPLDSDFFGKWDRFLGGILGMIKGVLFIAFLAVALMHLLPAESSLLKNSRILPYAVPISRSLEKFAPKKFKEDFMAKPDTERESHEHSERTKHETPRQKR